MKPEETFIIFGCEESQVVTKEFRKLGFQAFSCDLKPCSGGNPDWHFQQSIFEILKGGGLITQSGKTVFVKQWKAGVFFPPCTFLSSVQTHLCRRMPERVVDRIEAAMFFMQLYNCGLDFISVENPAGVMKHIFREPDQTIHPFFFGGDSYKRTCLWLRGFPLLTSNKEKNLFEDSTYGTEPEPLATYVQKSTGKKKNIHFITQPRLSGEERSKLSPYIARAMAEQWGKFLIQQ